MENSENPKPKKQCSSFPLSWEVAKKTFQELIQPTIKLDLSTIVGREGDVVVLTGGARGLGADVTKRLLKCGFHVVLGVRSIEAAEKFISSIRDNDGIQSGQTTLFPLDLKSLESVKKFANLVLESFQKIHVLICNAGIMFSPYELTEDGFESQFQVDYLSHFLLTDMLLERMWKTAEGNSFAGRIVNVSSSANYCGQLKDLSDIETRSKEYNKYKAYCDAKLAQVAMSNWLDRCLKMSKANVYVYSLHPGAIPTDLHAHQPPSFAKKFLRTSEDGADVIVCAAASPKYEKNGGIYLMNCKIELPNSQSLDASIQESLWNKSLKALKMDSSSVKDLLTPNSQ